MSIQENPLVAAALEGGAEALEAVWLDHIDPPQDPGFYLAGIDALPEAHRRGVAGSLLGLLLEQYKERGSHVELLTVARHMGSYRPKKLDLHAVCLESLQAQWGGEDWYELFSELAQIDELDLSEGLERFDRLRSLLPGSVVYHKSGWAEGLVTGTDLGESSFTVVFRQDGRERSMPFKTGLDVLKPLPKDDLRARLLTDMEGLKEDAESEPSRLIRAVARLHKNRATAKEVKEWLSGAVVPSSSWASWWRKAKIAAGRDPFLAVDNPSRPIFVLRKRALSPEEEAVAAMDRARTLAQLLEVVRGPLSLDPEEGLANAMLDRVAAEVETAELGDAGRVEAVLTLARHGRTSQAEAGALVAEEGKVVGGVAALVSSLKPAPLRREALEAFMAAEPKLWSDALIGDLPALSPQLLDVVTDRMLAEGRGAALANRLGIFLLSPSRQPATVMRLAKRFAAGTFDGVDEAPALPDVVMGLLHLAETQAPRAARDDKAAKDAMKGVEDVFFGKRSGLMSRFGETASRTEMERAMGVLKRTATMPTRIEVGLGQACHARFPDLVPRDETPFWEGNNIFCSQQGIARRQEELRVLLEEKIPENSEQIGRAASYGDLSENYEWTAAIEQQRQLTEKAAAMQAELKLARSIEDEELEAGIVSPGTRVTYEEAGQTKTITILGPWDIGDGVVSYRAPVAAGMLGAKAGETAQLDLPGGAVDVKVLEIDPVL